VVSVSEQADLTPAEMFARLQEVDPEMARRLHANNARKVQRSLQVFYQTGVPHSELLARQEREQRGSQRYFDACAFWVHATQPVLTARLETRVDKMLVAGLVDEIKTLRAHVKAHPPPRVGANDELDASVGILQAIGYKEFQPYFDALDAAESDDGGGDAPPDVDSVLRECVEQLNVATRQYARRQLSWIRNKFVTKNIPVYQVDSSDVDKWDESVARPAIDIASRFLAGEAIAPAYKSVQEQRPETARGRSLADKFAENECEICGGRKFLGDTQWREHLSSKGHKYHMKRVELEKAGVTRGHKIRRPIQPTDTTLNEAGSASNSDSSSKGDDADAAESSPKRHKPTAD
jgi:tRNA dimethylallyltransferase